MLRAEKTSCHRLIGNMDKLLEFGRKALFVIRVLSGYEERRIRSHRVQLQRRLEQVRLTFILCWCYLNIHVEFSNHLQVLLDKYRKDVY